MGVVVDSLCIAVVIAHLLPEVLENIDPLKIHNIGCEGLIQGP